MMLEAKCQKCGEVFNPENDRDLEHAVRADGELCEGPGTLLGAWLTREEVARHEELLEEAAADSNG